MPSSLPRPSTEYHLQIAVETVSDGGRILRFIGSMTNSDISWEGYEVFKDETADGLTHLAITIPVAEQGAAENLLHYLNTLLDDADHLGSTACIRSVDPEGTVEYVDAIA